MMDRKIETEGGTWDGIKENEVDGVLRVILLMDTSFKCIEPLPGFFGAKVGRGTLIDEIDGIRL